MRHGHWASYSYSFTGNVKTENGVPKGENVYVWRIVYVKILEIYNEILMFFFSKNFSTFPTKKIKNCGCHNSGQPLDRKQTFFKGGLRQVGLLVPLVLWSESTPLTFPLVLLSASGGGSGPIFSNCMTTPP